MSEAPRRRRGLGVLFALFVVSALAAGALAAWGYARYQAFVDGPLSGVEAGDSVFVEAGDSFPRVLEKLRQAGIRDGHALEWRLLARRLGAAGRLQVGEYAMEPGISASELLVRMRDGKVIHHRFTIVEGWNIRELRAALARAEPLLQASSEMDDAALMEALDRPGVHPEGRFLPETYLYTRGDSDLDLLRRAGEALDRALEAAWEARAPDLPLQSAEEALILASIVEKETGVPAERGRIAGVFVRRLRAGMRLQTDPTVIYGIGSAYDGNIRRRDLLTDTPYNTYTRDGLPPTPIAMPGTEALRAATRPEPGDSLYFVAIGDGSGRHVFTRTYAEHSAAVREYLRRYRDRHGASSQ
ncbi:endolytic transglycosylase MltG [Luteimonas sp. RD2P54]|uniref:Endolytic murein transglycosylase n=1 Tax=Luteimonas endophytica TaxID=3042023 RepID=A0ABT6J450_9GAMM|nr:endolytic transglycosylase MltG [Luteimonas endophytica]MDH5821390.1 endolytic transglycosylase MltG [Luteimonas endophytica]